MEIDGKTLKIRHSEMRMAVARAEDVMRAGGGPPDDMSRQDLVDIIRILSAGLLELQQRGDEKGYEKFLEDDLEHVDALTTKLVVEHMRRTPPGTPLDPTILEIKEGLGDDWYVDLSEDEQKVVGAHEGWRDPGWEDDPIKLWKEGNADR